MNKSKRNISIFNNRAVDGMSLRKIAERYDISHERVRQIYYRILRQIQHLFDLDKNSTCLKDVECSVRLHNALYEHGYTDLKQLYNISDWKILSFRGVGRKTLEEFHNLIGKEA